MSLTKKQIRQDGKFDDADDVKLALTALKAVPISVWKKVR